MFLLALEFSNKSQTKPPTDVDRQNCTMDQPVINHTLRRFILIYFSPISAKFGHGPRGHRLCLGNKQRMLLSERNRLVIKAATSRGNALLDKAQI